MRRASCSSGLLRFHHLALHSRAALGDDESVDHQRLLERREKAVPFFIPGGRERLSDANG
jgi:succinylarginine dihydrolase